MKNKILQDVLDWCNKKNEQPDLFIEDFVETVINRTTETLLEELKNELKNEFKEGNLKQSFIISDEYYIYLKLKEIKNKIIQPEKDEDYIEKEELNTEKIETKE